MRGEIANLVGSWRTLFMLALTYGFFPRFFLRIIVLAFHRDDPRRAELLGEIAHVPLWRRPFWVAEQLEVALFEGAGERLLNWIHSWAAGRFYWRWHIESGVEMNRRWPTTFWIPEDSEKAMVVPGCSVRLAFASTEDWRERMWVRVTKVGRRRLVGHVANTPFAIPGLWWDKKVRFTLDDVIDIDWDTESFHDALRKKVGPCLSAYGEELGLPSAEEFLTPDDEFAPLPPY